MQLKLRKMTLPEAFITQMKDILGNQVTAFLQALDSPPPISIRLNTFKNFNWKENFGKVKWNSNGIYLKERPVFTLDPAFHAGAYYVQEASSMLVGAALQQLVDLSQPLRVLDFCAAPGGKSTLLSDFLAPNSFLLANEVIKSRYYILQQNLTKWGLPNTHISNHDAKDFSRLLGFFDVVVMDAPCSGEGLFRKDPAAMNEWSEANVQLCCQRQKRILAEAIKTVRPGGILLYCTCTYNDHENAKNAEWIIDQFDLEICPLSFSEEWGLVHRSPGFQCYPHLVKGEGFYLAAFRKKEAAGQSIKTTKSFKKWQPLTRKERAIVQPWLAEDQAVSLFRNEAGTVRAILEEQLADAFAIAENLSRIALGTTVGILKRKDFVPSHDLALSTLIASQLPFIEVNQEQALLFLSKEPFILENIPQGWHLVRYQHLNLGWIKGLKNRINNYYPKEWRIRMDWQNKKGQPVKQD